MPNFKHTLALRTISSKPSVKFEAYNDDGITKLSAFGTMLWLGRNKSCYTMGMPSHNLVFFITRYILCEKYLIAIPIFSHELFNMPTDLF